jgi:hypothetical protein
MFELKCLKPQALAAAQRKAVRYRLLNEPRLAESICHDILAVDADNQDALITLILSLSDQFGTTGGPSTSDAKDLVPRLEGEYEREYYAGIVCERRAMSQLEIRGHGSGRIAYDWFRRAMAHFEKAEALSPADNDDAVLRWNTCARIINQRADLRPAEEHVETMLE